MYAVPRPVHVTAAQITLDLASSPPPAPAAPASAGQQLPGVLTLSGAPTTAAAALAAPAVKAATPAVKPAPVVGQLPLGAPAALVKERLFADPNRSASFQAGGAQQIASEQQQISSFHEYFTSTLHLARSQYTLAPLRKGAIVVAGTVLGRIAGPGQTLASHLLFQIQPAGKNSPQIDPKPILDGWKLLEATAVYRAADKNPFFGPDAKNASIGQVLLMSKEQLQQRILADPHVKIYTCGQRDIQAGLVDRRVLAAIEFLSGNGLDPTVSGLVCGHSLTGASGTEAANGSTDAGTATGSSVDISQINAIPVLGHQGTGSITDIAIRRLLTLQAALKPNQIVSLMSYKGQSNTLALPDHADRLQVTYTPLFGANKTLSAQIASALKPAQWIDLIKRLGQIPEPAVPIATSKYAVKTGG
jgi:hypothetical protein